MAVLHVAGFQGLNIVLPDTLAWALHDSVMKRMAAGRGFYVRYQGQPARSSTTRAESLWIGPSTALHFQFDGETKPDNLTSEFLDQMVDVYGGYHLTNEDFTE